MEWTKDNFKISTDKTLLNFEAASLSFERMLLGKEYFRNKNQDGLR